MPYPPELANALVGVTDPDMRNEIIARYMDQQPQGGAFGDEQPVTPVVQPAPSPQYSENFAVMDLMDKGMSKYDAEQYVRNIGTKFSAPPKQTSATPVPSSDPNSPFERVGPQAPVGAQPGGRVGFSRSGPQDPGTLRRVQGDLSDLRQAQQDRDKTLMQPYQVPDETSYMEEHFGPLDPETIDTKQAEYQHLASKPEKSIAELNRMQELSVDIATATGQAKAKAEAAYKKEALGQQEELYRSQQAAEAARQGRMQNAITDLEQAQEQLKDAKIDPERWYGTGPGKRIGAAIATALGAMGAAQGGIPNYALQIINDAVNRDIMAQKAELNKKGQLVSLQQNMLSVLRGQGMDERAAENAARVILKDRAAQGLDILASQYQDKELKAKAIGLKSELQKNTAIDMRNYLMSSEQAQAARLQAEGNLAAQRESLGLQRAQIAWQRRAAALNARAAKPLPKDVIRGMSAYASAEEMLDQMEKDFIAHAEGRWIAATSGLNQFLPTGTDAAQYGDFASLAAGQIGRNLNKGERFTDEDEERWQGYVPTAGDSKERGLAKIENMRKMVRRKKVGELRAYGKTGYDVTPFIADAMRQEKELKQAGTAPRIAE